MTFSSRALPARRVLVTSETSQSQCDDWARTLARHTSSRRARGDRGSTDANAFVASFPSFASSRRRRRRARDVSFAFSIMMNRARRTNDARDVSRAMDDARGESDGESESESDSEGSRAGEAREWMPRYRLDSDVVERLMTAETSKGEGAADVGPPMFAVGRRARRRRGGKKRSKRRRDSKRKKRVRERIIVSDHSTEKIQNETVAVLKGTRTEKQILKANQDIEVVILGLETVGLLKSKYKKTYVQVKWKPHHAESRKVKTFRREDTDNPIWGTRGK